MTESEKCSRCGATLPANAPGGQCLPCRQQLGLPTGKPSAATKSGDPFPDHRSGDRISHYKLLQQIGEGGCGVVYLAEQEEPVRRRVALKIIKLGMDTRRVITRFEAERQALAMMDHPSIAKVLDAGATPTGRPYFVMELVRGIRITDYCDQNHLSIRSRLDLFTQICRAIQHAHQKGIIHRDIKPSNILITLQDGGPVPKVIDFGIAKATNDQWLTDKTPLTPFEQFLGTPVYMSPEQAGRGELDIDTRSDIYSLGVLLYELLTGRTPFAAEELLAAGLDNMRRMIREQDPPKPSTRLGTMGSADTADVTNRFRTSPTKLAARVRGDLDWIVMKALEKDRARRYESASGLAMDIQRHLDNEPIVARPPSAAYRFQKLVRRNRIAVAAAGAVAAALIIGLVSSTWLFLREKAEARKSETVAQFLKGMLKSLNPALAQGRHTPMLHEILDNTAERVATDLTAQPEIQAELESIIGNAYYELEDFSKADAMYREALRVRTAVFGATHGLVAASLNDLGNALAMEDRQAEGETLQRQALAMRRTLFGNESREVANSLTSLADTLTDQRRLAEAEALQRAALTLQKKLPGVEPADVSVSLNNLGRIFRLGDRPDQAEAVYREVLALATDHEKPAYGDSLLKLAGVLRDQGKLAEAESLCRRALALTRRQLGKEHPMEILSFNNLALLLQRQGKLAEVEALFREHLRSLQERLPVDDAEIIGNLGELTRILVAENKFTEAEPLARECLAILERKLPDDWRTFNCRSLVASTLLGQKRHAEAEALLLSAYEGMNQRAARIPDASQLYFKETLERLIELYAATGRPDQADEWRQKRATLDPPAVATPSPVETKPR